MSCPAVQAFGSDVANGVTCPLCSGSDLRTLGRFEDRALLQCGACHLAYVFPQLTGSALAAHFESDDVAGEADRERRFERNRESVLARVAGYVHRRKNAGDILDVGCATGYFLTRFFSGGDWRIWGVDLSAKFAEKAAEKGVRVYCGDVSQALFAGQSFDVITVLDAFYYFPNPKATLGELHRRLKPGGLLLLDMPLAGSRIWRGTSFLGRLLSGSRFPLLQTSDHLFYYQPKSIARLVEQCGFAIQSISPLPGNRHADWLRDGLNRSFSCLSQALNIVSGSRIFLGPRFLVAALKRTD